MEKWIDGGEDVSVVMEDSVGGGKVKMKEVKDRGRIVMVGKGKRWYVRKGKECKEKGGLKNCEGVYDLFESWIGKEERRVDYVWLGEKLVDWVSGVVEGGEVKLMKEVRYVRGGVRKEGGMFGLRGRKLEI